MTEHGMPETRKEWMKYNEENPIICAVPKQNNCTIKKYRLKQDINHPSLNIPRNSIIIQYDGFYTMRYDGSEMDLNIPNGLITKDMIHLTDWFEDVKIDPKDVYLEAVAQVMNNGFSVQSKAAMLKEKFVVVKKNVYPITWEECDCHNISRVSVEIPSGYTAQWNFNIPKYPTLRIFKAT